MATVTYGTTGGNNIARITSANRAIISSFTPDNWGGNTNPQESRELYVVTKITVYAKLGTATTFPQTSINVVMGSSTGSFNKADTLAYNTSDGSQYLKATYGYYAGNVSAVLGSNNEYYGGFESNNVGGGETLRGSASGETVYVVQPSDGSVTYTWSNNQQYLSLEYYGLPNAPTGLSATTTGQNSVSLSWSSVGASGVATAADGYKVQYKQSSSSTWIDFTSTTSTSSSVSGLSAGTSYDFRVAAYDTTISNTVSNATGPWSSTASATTTSSVPAPTWSGSYGSGQEQEPYYDLATASGATTISLVSGSLPPGLNGIQSGEYYIIQGTPTVDETYSFTLKASNAGGDDYQTFSIYISPQQVPQWSDQTILTSATVGDSYSDGVSATGADSYSYSGTLPPGMSLNSSTGALTASSLTTAGSYSFTIFASNEAGSTQAFFTINVATAVLNGGRRMTDSSNSTQLTTYKRYNGSSWIELTTAKRFNGSIWEDI